MCKCKHTRTREATDLYDDGVLFCDDCYALIEKDGSPAHRACLDEGGRTPCAGPVEYRMALSPSGRNFPRCEFHWGKRLDKQEEINERYPDTPCPPDDFDPLYAGERWDEE